MVFAFLGALGLLLVGLQGFLALPSFLGPMPPDPGLRPKALAPGWLSWPTQVPKPQALATDPLGFLGLPRPGPAPGPRPQGRVAQVVR